MSSQYEIRAKDVVAQFKAEAGEVLKSQLTPADEDRLAQMISAAITSEVDGVIEKLDSLTREVRNQRSVPEMAM